MTITMSKSFSDRSVFFVFIWLSVSGPTLALWLRRGAPIATKAVFGSFHCLFWIHHQQPIPTATNSTNIPKHTHPTALRSFFSISDSPKTLLSRKSESFLQIPITKSAAISMKSIIIFSHHPERIMYTCPISSVWVLDDVEVTPCFPQVKSLLAQYCGARVPFHRFSTFSRTCPLIS